MTSGIGRIIGGVGLAALIASGACNDSAGPGTPGDLSSAELDEIELAFADDIDLSIGALFHGGMANGFQPEASAFMGPRPWGPHDNGLRCLVIEPLPPEDPDMDGVPTRLALRFDPDPCVLRMGRTAIEFSGSVSISDPVPNEAGYDVDEVIDHFGVAHTLPNGRAKAMVRNGTRSVSHDAGEDVLTAQERILTTHSTPGRAFKEAGADWQLTFDGEDAIEFQRPLPNGSLVIEGTWVFRKTNHERSFVVTTPTALAYDAGCTDARPLHRFTEGEVHKTLMRDGVAVAVLKLTWTGCGEAPTREVTRTTDTT